MYVQVLNVFGLPSLGQGASTGQTPSKSLPGKSDAAQFHAMDVDEVGKQQQHRTHATSLVQGLL